MSDRVPLSELERVVNLIKVILSPYCQIHQDGDMILARSNDILDLYVVKIHSPTQPAVEILAVKVVNLKPSRVVIVSQIEGWKMLLEESLRDKGFDVKVELLSPIDVGNMTVGYLPFSEHVGIAVSDLREAEKKFEEVLGVKPAGRHRVESEGLTASFIWLGSTRIELLEPFSSDSAVKSFLEKRGEGIHHIAVQVDDFDKRVNELREKGYRIIGPKIGATGRKVAFVHPKDFMGILLELVEKGYREESFH